MRTDHRLFARLNTTGAYAPVFFSCGEPLTRVVGNLEITEKEIKYLLFLLLGEDLIKRKTASELTVGHVRRRAK